MRFVRLGALIGVAVVTTAFALSANSCAPSTTITLEVRTRPELCGNGQLRLSETGIAVTIDEKVDDPSRSPLKDFQSGCANKATGSIGTLVITPSGAKDQQIAIRVVAALNDNSAESCDDTEGKALKNCIVTKRLARFVEGSNVPVTVIIEPECNGVDCPAGLVCVKGGKCAPPDAIQNNPDGLDASATRDATGVSDVEPQKKDADTNVIDAGPCSRCTTPNGEKDPLPGRSCVNGKCTINCAVSGAGCGNKNVCVDDDRLNYVIDCKGVEGVCAGTTCLGPKNKVTFNCVESQGSPTPHCSGIECNGVSCDIVCDNIKNTCNNVRMTAKTNKMQCNAVQDNEPACDNITCLAAPGGSCTRVCDKAAGGGTLSVDAGCGTTSSCDAGPNGCKEWQVNDGG